MLKTVTGLSNIQLDIAEIDGSHYLFHSGETYYLYNVANEEGVCITEPKDYNQLLAQMQKDFRKVQVKPLDE
jgi:hypothetical protein